MAVLDKLIHERARLLILTHLASNGEREVSFNELQSKLGLTSGNLSIQLKKLKSAEYVRIHKTFKHNKPFTTAAITLKGTKALNAYLDEMEQLIKTLKEGDAK
jgi:DNA-binding MarR family transcriptional regulator